MRIFVSEFLTSGACPEVPLDSSLMREGKLMADALLEDLEALDGVQTLTTRDTRFDVDANRPSRQTFRARSSDEARTLFDDLVRNADAVMIIAPETDDLLENRVRRVAERAAHIRLLNCESETIARCADKLTLPEFLDELAIPVVSAAPIDFENRANIPFEFPVVVKPRYGAGCEETYCIETEQVWNRVLGSIHARRSGFDSRNWIVQPFVPGVSLSSVAVFRSDGSLNAVLPLGQQIIRRDDVQLSYRGGSIPWHSAGSAEAAPQNEMFFTELGPRLPGLRGYVGADWIWDDVQQRLHLVEINPRLTTSYLGYRELYGTQLAASLLEDEIERPFESNGGDRIQFDVEGTIERLKAPSRSKLRSYEKSGECLP
jgi:tyramine---L-glutamate ligase